VRTLIRKVFVGAAIAALSISSLVAQAQRNWKDRAEYDLYVGITQAIQGNDGKKALDLLKEWGEKYPESDYSDTRPTLELNAYKAANDSKGMLTAADKILGANPNDLTANYWVCTLMVSNPSPTDEELARAAKSGSTLANIQKPAEVQDAQWPAIKKEMTALGHKCSGYVAMQRKDQITAETEFEKSLAIKATDAQINSMLGNVILAQKDPQKQSEALFHYARAASYTGEGALPDQTRQQLDTFFTNAYKRFRGDDPEGMQELRNLAKSQPLPPSDFRIMTEAEAKAEAEERMKNEQPQLYFWVRLKEALEGETGAAYFEEGMKDALVPSSEQLPLKGTVIEGDRKTIKLAMSDDTTPEVTLVLDQALRTAPEPGTVVEFWGVAQKLTREPFMVEFLIAGEQAKMRTVEQ
jgi:tetratricopeptide (TPR) repeat protein